jgi:anti-sigma regulatory factor (Ser/Thr protein kinase)
VQHPARDLLVDRPVPVALLEMAIEPEVDQGSQIRHSVTSILQAVGQGPVAPDAALVVSELVANAVAHARARVRFAMWTVGSVLHIQVHDDGQGRPELLHVEPGVAEGRGLFIVDQLATRWGVDDSESVGKTVWCELALSTEPEGTGRERGPRA